MEKMAVATAIIVLLAFSMLTIQNIGRVDVSLAGGNGSHANFEQEPAMQTGVFSSSIDPPFVKTIGGLGLDFGRSVIQTSDGNFVITGPWDYSGAVSSDLFLIKVDPLGNPIWAEILKGFPTDNFETGNQVIETSTGDLVVVGHSNSFTGDFNAIISRLTSNGIWIWTYTLIPPAPATSFGLSVTETSDHGFVITGPIWNYPLGMGMDLYIVKFDANGIFVWGKVLVGIGDDCGCRVIEEPITNDLIVTGGPQVLVLWTYYSPDSINLAVFNGHMPTEDLPLMVTIVANP